MFRDQIIKSLQEVTGVENPYLELTASLDHGDYASNVALQQAKQEGKNPRELAQEYVKKLSESNTLIDIVAKVEVAGPGFVNFYLSDTSLSETLRTIINKQDRYGHTTTNSNKKVMFEYGQPNTHKLPHIGHLFSYILGESITRILETTGWEVKRVNYQGDIGLHVAKCLWSFKKDTPEIPSSLEEKVALLQRMYQQGSQAFEEDEEGAKNEIIKINQQIYDQDSEIVDLWRQTREWSLEYYKAFEKRLGIRFEKYYFESEVYKRGIEIVKTNIGKVFETGEHDALIFRGSEHGLHDRVFLTQYGTPTYEAKDLALQNVKLEDWPADLLVITTANEQNEYFKVVFKALETLDPKFKDKLKHLGFGMVNLKSGKMSSRTGNIVGAVELVESTVEQVSKLSPNISEEVGIGAVKYSFLKSNPLQNLQFSLEESISKEGNSGPYLQYTFARTQSVLEKAQDRKLDFHASSLGVEEQNIIRFLARFPEVIDDAANLYSPNVVATYLFELAQMYNSFYNNNRILDSENEAERLVVTQSVGVTIKNGLKLLGIEAPVKM